MADKFDPYHKWLGIPPRDQPPHHYRLLSIDLFESDPEVIDAAARRLAVYVKSCASGPHQAEAKKLLTEIVQARHCLLDPQLRAAYDQRLTAPPPGAPPIEMAPAIETAPARGPAKPAAPTKSTAAAGDATAPARSVAPVRRLWPRPCRSPRPPFQRRRRLLRPIRTGITRRRSPTCPTASRRQAKLPPLDAPVADTPTEPLDTLMDMPVGITTLPDPTPIGKGHKSGSHKSGGHKSAAKKWRRQIDSVGRSAAAGHERETPQAESNLADVRAARFARSGAGGGNRVCGVSRPSRRNARRRCPVQNAGSAAGRNQARGAAGRQAVGRARGQRRSRRPTKAPRSKTTSSRPRILRRPPKGRPCRAAGRARPACSKRSSRTARSRRCKS